jgi:hypothetical protein
MAIPPQQPFLFLTKESQLPPRTLERFESMPEVYWISLHGASHQSFTDGPLLQPSFLPGAGQADRVLRSIQEYSLAFLDQTLKGQHQELLARSFDGEAISVKIFPSQ